MRAHVWIALRILFVLSFSAVVAQDVLKNEILLSTPRIAFTSIEVDGKIYFAGGFDNTDRASSTIDVFDIATQTWNNTLQLSEPRAFVTPVAIPPHIYFVGGRSFDFDTSAYLYDFGPPNHLNALPRSHIKDPMQVSIHGTTLTALGSFHAEFMDLANKTAEWSTNEELDTVYGRIAGGIKFTHENLIFIFGGVNVSSRQPVSDAWIFDIETSNLTRYDDVINPIGYVNSGGFYYSVTNNIMAAWTTRTRDCFFFNLDTRQWFNFTVSRTLNIISIPGFTYIFTFGGYYTVDWSNSTADPAFTSVPTQIIHTIGFADQVAFLYSPFDAYTIMRCTYNGTWITSSVTTSIDSVVTSLDWPSHGHVISTGTGFYLFKNCSMTYVSLEDIQSIVVAYPQADLLYVLVGKAFVAPYQLRMYNATLDLVATEDVPIITPTMSFDNFLIDFTKTTIIDVNGGLYADIVDGQFGANTLWTVSGEYFVAMIARQQTPVFSSLVDIYNYENNTWLAPTNTVDTLNPDYNQAFNMDGVLAILTTNTFMTFNVSTYSWTLTTTPITSRGTPLMTIAPLVVEVNGTVYATTNVVYLKIITGSVTDISEISNSEYPTQIIYHKPSNQLFIPTSQNIIYTWNIDNRGYNIFLFPRSDEGEIIVATSGNFLLVSSRSSDVFDYCDLSSSGWGNVTGVTNYFRPACMHSFGFNDTSRVLVAGGYDKLYNYYTDSVRLLDISPLQSLPAPVSNGPFTTLTGPESDPQVDNTTLIVAIVVPVGVVLIGSGLLALFLIRRQKKRKNKGNQASMIGLEQQYGQWFIPFSDLTFHEQLGQGGSGQVFKGSWKNTSVALKLSMTQAHSSVISELALMMQLRPHPNVVQLLGFSVHPETDSIVLVLEYCNGGALDSVLFDGKAAVSMKQKLDWLIGISKGVSHLHSNNIVHRDIAARNVLLHQNEAKITDFGMSRIVDDQQQRGTTKSELGPIRWMSPESLSRKEYSTKSDVWSFGIVAYEIIAQQEPHFDHDPIQVGQEIRDSGLTPQLPDTCPNGLASVIKSCWNMDPSQRPTFEQITSQLEHEMTNL